MKDPDAPLVLLEYLAVRKCHRLEGAAAANNHPANRESLLRAKNAAAAVAHAVIEGDETTTSIPSSPRVLHWLQRILETLFLDSYQASRRSERQGFSSRGGGVCAGRAAAIVDDLHVLEAIRALGVNVQGGGVLERTGGATKDGQGSSRRALRAWRVLLLRHVARSALGRPRRHRIRVSIRAIQVLQRFAASLVDPDSVRLYMGPDGCQISFQSKCGTFKANFFEFFNDDEDETMADELGVGKWIGAVIDCLPVIQSQERSPVARRYVPDLDDEVEGDGSTLGSISREIDDDCNEEEEEGDDDSTHYKQDSDQEMSTASMTSSLSTTSSRSSSSISSTRMGSTSTAPLLLTARGNRPLVSDDGADRVGAANGLVAPPPHRFRLTLSALLVATAKVAGA